MNINVVDIKNKEIEKFDINFDENTVINRKAISQVVKWQLSKRRSGTASTKNRALVNASNKKPFKQKGTGNARAGSRTSPIWRGGGVIFGPQPKDWSINVPKKIKKLALLHSLLYQNYDHKYTNHDTNSAHGSGTDLNLKELQSIGFFNSIFRSLSILVYCTI